MKKLVLILFLLLLLAIGVIVYGYYTLTRQQTTYGSGFEFGTCEEISERDIYELCVRTYENDPEEFEAILLTNKFHGYIEPNSIYGAKMALYAKKILGGSDIFVLSEAGMETPVSSLNDGIMTAIGATFGKGLIVNDEHKQSLAATFKHNDELVRLEVRKQKLDISEEHKQRAIEQFGVGTDGYYEELRKMGLYVWEYMDQGDLFELSYPEDRNFYCEYTEKNVQAYYFDLNNLLLGVVSKEDILAFIEEYPCVEKGVVDDSVYPVVVQAVWKENGETVEFVR